MLEQNHPPCNSAPKALEMVQPARTCQILEYVQREGLHKQEYPKLTEVGCYEAMADPCNVFPWVEEAAAVTQGQPSGDAAHGRHCHVDH